jgi:hypothetical protein
MLWYFKDLQKNANFFPSKEDLFDSFILNNNGIIHAVFKAKDRLNV